MVDEALVHVFYGPEAFLRERSCRRFIEQQVEPEARELDYIQLRADEGDTVQQVIEHLEMMPFLASRRVVVLKQADKYKAEDFKLLAQYAARPNPQALFIMDAEALDARLAGVKALLNAAMTHEFKPERNPRKMAEWVAQEAANLGKSFAPTALEQFMQLVEPDCQTIVSELEKLALYNPDNRLITAAEVQDCIGQSRTHAIYELNNAVGSGNRARAFTILNQVLQEDDRAIVMVISSLTRFFVQLYRINAHRAAGKSEDYINQNSMPGVHPFYRKDYLAYARKWRNPLLLHCFKYMLEADRGVKSLPVRGGLLGEIMLYKIFRCL